MNKIFLISTLFFLFSCKKEEQKPPISTETKKEIAGKDSVKTETVKSKNVWIKEGEISSNQKSELQDAALRDVIIKVIKAYQNKDEKTLNSFIHKDFGLAILYARGAFDNIAITKQFSFSKPIPEYLPYETSFETNYKITNAELPIFSCDTETWDKSSGIYINTNERENSLSEIAKRENKITEEIIWTEKEIKKLEKIENVSHQVILISKENVVFIFYLGFIEKNWYLTAIDRFEVCSA